MKRNFKDLLLGNLFIFIATLFWGLNVPADKFMVPLWISGAQLGVVRIVGCCVLVWLTSLFLKMEPIDRGDYKVLGCAGVANFAFIVLLSMSFKYASPVDISIILAFPPMIVIAIRGIFLHVKVSREEIVGVIIAFAGTLFLILLGANGEKGSDNLLGDIICFVSTICFASYLVLMEKPSKKYSPFNLTRWVMLVASVCCIPFFFSIGHEKVFTHPEAFPLILLGLIVLLPSYAAYLFVPPSIKRIGADIESMYQYILPVIATVASIAFGLAKFHWYQPVAFIIILVGVYLANRSKFRPKKAPTVITSTPTAASASPAKA